MSGFNCLPGSSSAAERRLRAAALLELNLRRSAAAEEVSRHVADTVAEMGAVSATAAEVVADLGSVDITVPQPQAAEAPGAPAVAL